MTADPRPEPKVEGALEGPSAPLGVLRRAERVLLRALEGAVILVMALLVLDVLWGVVSRYVLGHQARWTEELAIALLVWVSLLASALVFRSHGHLGIDLLVEKMDAGARRLADLFATAVTVLFAGSAMVFGGGTLVVQAIDNGQTLPALGVSMAWVHAAIPVSGLFIVLFGLAHPTARGGAGERPPASGEGAADG